MRSNRLSNRARRLTSDIRLNTPLTGEIKDKFIDISEWMDSEYSSNNDIIIAIINRLHKIMEKEQNE